MLVLSEKCARKFTAWWETAFLFVSIAYGRVLDYPSQINAYSYFFQVTALVVGGFLGAVSLLLLLCNFYKPWRSISYLIRSGCLIGVIANVLYHLNFNGYAFLTFSQDPSRFSPSLLILWSDSCPTVLFLILVFHTTILNNRFPPYINKNTLP